MALDGITLRAICKELHDTLTGGKIDKINQAEKDELILHIRSSGEKYKLLLSASSINPRIYLAQNYQKENPMQAPMFLMLLRKHIGSGRITGFLQRGLERSIEMQIESYDELHTLRKKTLVIEIMGKHSNIILVDEEERKVIDSIKRIPLTISSVREVLPGRAYLLPPSQNKLDPLQAISLETFQRTLSNQPSNILKSIYQCFEGISPLLSSEICFRASIATDQPALTLTDIQMERLFNSFQRIMDSVKHHQYNPNRITDPSTHGNLAFSSIRLTQFEEKCTLLEKTSISSICEEFFSLKDRQERLDQQSSDLRKSLQVKIDRLKSKLEKQVTEITEAQGLDVYRKKGELLTASIHLLSKGMKEAILQDYYQESLPLISISLDIHKTPSENVQWYFKKYNKSKSRIKELTEHIQETKEELLYLEHIQYCISSCEAVEELREIKTELYKEGYIQRLVSPSKKQKIMEQSKPHHYIASDGSDIFVGKNNTQNDQLTLRFASKDDMWLHTKQIPGSHVIIKTSGKEVQPETLKEAATLAAYYSKARGSSQVPVDYAEKKHVKKPAGAKPGMVLYDHYSTVYVNPSEEFVQNLKRIDS